MATAASVAARRGTAEAAIRSAVASLAEKHGVEIVDEAYNVRDIELRRVIDLEMMAKNLEAIVDKATPKKKAEKVDEVTIIEDGPKGKKKKDGNA